MFAKRIVPCLDVKDGRVVKGINFVNLRDAGDPIEQAKIYDQMGADELVFLDISATPQGHDTTLEIVRSIAEQVFLPLTVGGGIREVGDIRKTLLAGADKVSINSAAVNDPTLLTESANRFGLCRQRAVRDGNRDVRSIVQCGGRTAYRSVSCSGRVSSSAGERGRHRRSVEDRLEGAGPGKVRTPRVCVCPRTHPAGSAASR